MRALMLWLMWWGAVAHAGPGPIIADGVRVATGLLHTCVVDTSGDVWCWGSHELGQLGLGPIFPGGVPADCRTNDVGPVAGALIIECDRPQHVSLLPAPAIDVVAGDLFTCALLVDGRVQCWGSNLYGQVGVQGVPNGCAGDPLDPQVGVWCTRPRPAGGLSDAVQIDAGDFHTCARRANGTVWCWGLDLAGQLGLGTGAGCERLPNHVPICRSPSKVLGLGGRARGIATGGGNGGGGHSCAILQDGSMECWGRFDSGQLGVGYQPAGCTDVDNPPDGRPEYCPSPTPVRGIQSASRVSAGALHTCATVRNPTGGRRTKCWGSHRFGQLGIGIPSGLTVCIDEIALGRPTNCYVPVGIQGAALTSLYGGSIRTFGRTTSGGLVGFGSNDRSSLGTGTPLPPACDPGLNACLTPEPIPGLGSGIFDASTSDGHSCATKTDGSVWCWGQNGKGSLGLGATVPPGCVDTSAPWGRPDTCETPVQVPPW